MIHINANTSTEIALALRGQAGEYDRILRAKEVADRLLGNKKDTSGIIVTAPRQSGKTTELLRYAEEKNPNGQFAFVCLNQHIIHSVCSIYRELRANPSASPPLMLLPSNLKLVGNETKPLFCDELGLFTEQMQADILGYRNFVAAVTS